MFGHLRTLQQPAQPTRSSQRQANALRDFTRGKGVQCAKPRTRPSSGRAIPLADRSDRVHAVAIIPHIVVVDALPLEGAMLVAIATFHARGLAGIGLILRPVRIIERLAREPSVLADSRLLRHLAVL